MVASIYSTQQPAFHGSGGGGDITPPDGMAFIFAENGEPIVDKNGAQIYALETV